MRPSLCIRNAQTFASMACISLNSFGFIIFSRHASLTGTDDFAALPLSWPGSVCWTDQKTVPYSSRPDRRRIHFLFPLTALFQTYLYHSSVYEILKTGDAKLSADTVNPFCNFLSGKIGGIKSIIIQLV